MLLDWDAWPEGNCNRRPRNSLLSKMFRLPISNTFLLDNWDFGVSWNNQFSFEIPLFLPRKGQIHPCSWCRLLGAWEWFISAAKWSVLQDMKFCCATRKPLDCLFSFTLLNLLNTKVIHACHYKSDKEEADIWQWCPLSTPTHRPAVRCVLVWCVSLHAF